MQRTAHVTFLYGWQGLVKMEVTYSLVDWKRGHVGTDFCMRHGIRIVYLHCVALQLLL